MQCKDRISMEKQKQIELLLERGYSRRKIAESLKICRRTVRRYARRFQLRAAGEKERPEKPVPVPLAVAVFEPSAKWAKELDWSEIVKENCRGVPTKTLYEESGLLDAVKYWNFWNTLKKAKQHFKPDIPETTLKLHHKPGERAHVDYCDGLDVANLETGELTKTQLFVVTFPFSSKIYAEFTLSQKLHSFIRSHENAWSAFGGVPSYTVPDNLKSAVTRADIYDPDVNKTFCDFANHCGFAVLPAKPVSPKHKASVESAAGLLQRVFYPKVRNTSFTSLRQLNEAIKLYVEQLNNEIMKEYGVSRNERFMQEQPHLKPLPEKKFEFADWKTLKVHPDCHIQCCRSFYSIPWQHVGREVRVKVTDSTVEVFDISKRERIVVHARSKTDYKRVTNIEHYPPEKAAAASFTIEIAKKQATRIGPNMEALLNELFNQSHPLRYLRPVQGWIRLFSSDRHSKGAIEYAASMSLKHSKFSSKYFKTCVDHFDRLGTDTDSNVRTLCPKRNNTHSYLKNKT